MRLIDADKLKETIKSPETFTTIPVKKHMCKIIDNAPTVSDRYDEGYVDGLKEGLKDEPIGKWIDHSEDYGYVECPKCEHLTNCEGNVDELHYCWNCGAKLGKGGAE